MKRLALVAAALAIAAGLFVLVVHTAPVRRAVLRYVLAEVQRRYALRVDASRLDYNLAALTIGLADVRVAAARTPDQPFFEAGYIRAALATRVLVGGIAFRDVSVASGRVHIVRGRDGLMNLPESSETPSGEPAPLNISHLSAPRFRIDIADAQQDAAITIPALTLDLGAEDGRLRLNDPATVRVGMRQTRIVTFDGGASFDGRALRLRSVGLEPDEASLQVDGVVSVIAANPGMDLHVTGTADTARVARWGLQGDELPRGTVGLDVRASGPFAAPVVDARLESSSIEWRQLAMRGVSLRAHVTVDAADIQDAGLTIAGGRVIASGRMPFDKSGAQLAASWSGVDATELTEALAGTPTLVPTGTVGGELSLQGSLAQLSSWVGDATIRVTGGNTGRKRVAVPGETRLRLEQGNWRIDARHELGNAIPIALAARGELDEASLASSTISGRLDVPGVAVPSLVRLLRTVGVADVDASLLQSGTASATVGISGRFTSPSVDSEVRGTDLSGSQFSVPAIRALVSGDVRTPNLSFMAQAPTVDVAGEHVGNLNLAGTLNGDIVSVASLAASQAAEAGRLRLNGDYNLRTERYSASAEIAQWTIAPTADRPLGGRIDATFSGTGSLDDPHGTASLQATGLSWDGASPGDLLGGVEIGGGAATIDLRAPELNAHVNGRVAVRAPYETSIDLRADDLDLQRVLAGAQLPTTISGHVSVSGHADLPLANWQRAAAVLDITSLQAAAGDLPITTAQPARLRFEHQRIGVDRLEVNAGATRLSASGELPLTEGSGSLAVNADGDIGEMVRAVAAAGLATLPITEGTGPLALRATISGNVNAPVVAADVDAGPGSLAINDLSTATDIRLRARVESDFINLLQAHASYEGAVLDATGAIPLAVVSPALARPSAMPASLHATVLGVTPGVLRGVLDPTTLEDLRGTVDLAVNVETPGTDFTRATGDLTLTRLDLQIADLPVTQQVPTRIVVRDGFARIESWNWTGTGATVGVFGQVRLADRQAAIIANGDIDLRVLSPFLRDAGLTTAGRLTPKLSITGPLDAPRVDGDVALDAGEVRLVDPRIIVNGLSARAVLTRTDMTLRTLSGSINGGSLTGGGNIVYRPETGLAAHLTTDIRDMALDFPAGLRSDLDAMLQFDATAAPDAAAPSGQITGTVTVLRGSYREPLAVVGGVLAALRTRGVAASGAAGEESDAFLRQLALDIRVVTDEDLVVDNNYARAQLGADVDLIGTAAAPALSGRALLREDGRLFVGRNVYTISRDVPSTIDFVSPTAIEPELNIHLETRAAGHDIEVALTGPAESPTVDMTSEGLGQADITAVLLTGRTLDQLGTADASFIGTQVIGNFSGEVLGFAGRAVGLDTLRLGGVEGTNTRSDPTAVASEVDPTSRLTFGKSLGSNVDLTFSQSLRDSTAQTWIVEYLPTRQLDVRYVLDDEDLSSYGFRHDVSFGGGTSASAPRAASAQRTEQRVADVSLSGNLAFPEERVRGLLSLRAGDRFDFARWQDDRDRLEDFYHRNGRLSARVSASRAVNADAVRLSYAIEAGPQTRVEVSGIDVGSNVTQQIDQAWATSILDELLVDEAARVVRTDLLQRGYVRPTVDAHVLVQGDVKTLRVDVQPGERGTEAQVRIQAADSGLADDLRARVRAANLENDVLTNPGAVTRVLTDYLRSRGYLRASVTASSPLVENGTAVLPIAVDPGPQFVLATITFEGRRNVPEEDVARLFDAISGSPYDPAAIDTARDRIAGLYRSRGFASATVTANAAVRAEEPGVDLTFEIQEGLRQTIGDVVVSGSGSIDTDVVTRALGLTVGASLEPADLLRARTRVFNTGLFRRVDVTTEAMPRISEADPVQPVRVRVALDPWPALRLRYGFQVSEERPENDPTGHTLTPGLSADITRRTLFGRAISLGGVVEYERRQNSARALLNAPTLMTLPIESSFVFERVHQAAEGTTFVSNRNGVSWEQRMRTGGHWTLSYSYRFDRDHTFDTRPATGSGLDFDITVNVARLIGNSAWDSRDDPLNATRGSLYSSSVQWAPDRLGSQFRFLKYVGQAYRFQTVHRVVFASAARLGLVRPLGGQELILSERFFAGGSRTVRGVDENALGPTDFLGDPAGGEAMLVLNQEGRIPIYKWLGGVAFIDAGNVFAHPSDLTLNGLTGSVGVGIRLSTPFALLRADYGKVMWPGPAKGSGRWSFGIGQAF